LDKGQFEVSTESGAFLSELQPQLQLGEEVVVYLGNKNIAAKELISATKLLCSRNTPHLVLMFRHGRGGVELSLLAHPTSVRSPYA
jgi:hypothetical protein